MKILTKSIINNVEADFFLVSFLMVDRSELMEFLSSLRYCLLVTYLMTLPVKNSFLMIHLSFYTFFPQFFTKNIHSYDGGPYYLFFYGLILKRNLSFRLFVLLLYSLLSFRYVLENLCLVCSGLIVEILIENLCLLDF